jgi:primosomal protein N'
MSSGGILCRNCHEKCYSWLDPLETDDWSTRMMKCEHCGFQETLEQNCASIIDKKEE